MNRYIRGYNTKTDKLIFEIELRNVPVTELRTALRITNDNPLYDCYPITLEVENILKSLNGLEILDRRDTEYFLEADA